MEVQPQQVRAGARDHRLVEQLAVAIEDDDLPGICRGARGGEAERAHIHVAVNVHGDPLGWCRSRRQGGEAGHLTAVPRGDRKRQ